MSSPHSPPLEILARYIEHIGRSGINTYSYPASRMGNWIRTHTLGTANGGENAEALTHGLDKPNLLYLRSGHFTPRNLAGLPSYALYGISAFGSLRLPEKQRPPGFQSPVAGDPALPPVPKCSAVSEARLGAWHDDRLAVPQLVSSQGALFCGREPCRPPTLRLTQMFASKCDSHPLPSRVESNNWNVSSRSLMAGRDLGRVIYPIPQYVRNPGRYYLLRSKLAGLRRSWWLGGVVSVSGGVSVSNPITRRSMVPAPRKLLEGMVLAQQAHYFQQVLVGSRGRIRRGGKAGSQARGGRGGRGRGSEKSENHQRGRGMGARARVANVKRAREAASESEGEGWAPESEESEGGGTYAKAMVKPSSDIRESNPKGATQLKVPEEGVDDGSEDGSMRAGGKYELSDELDEDSPLVLDRRRHYHGTQKPRVRRRIGGQAEAKHSLFGIQGTCTQWFRNPPNEAYDPNSMGTIGMPPALRPASLEEWLSRDGAFIPVIHESTGSILDILQGHQYHPIMPLLRRAFRRAPAKGSLTQRQLEAILNFESLFDFPIFPGHDAMLQPFLRYFHEVAKGTPRTYNVHINVVHALGSILLRTVATRDHLGTLPHRDAPLLAYSGPVTNTAIIEQCNASSFRFGKDCQRAVSMNVHTHELETVERADRERLRVSTRSTNPPRNTGSLTSGCSARLVVTGGEHSHLGQRLTLAARNKSGGKGIARLESSSISSGVAHLTVLGNVCCIAVEVGKMHQLAIAREHVWDHSDCIPQFQVF
ncbi:hypothetical protein FA13DRAFT_1878567 [Coprinellus micaceus]|uniref:Uncharacterized protein n=1 Tax=Coprinellus micaceus TaxID=71717 RepID=A0A4Y7T0K3_COPMI|nr:hypothetical protein FA13DRAFT_1878567 [Coprinellus micaceus]